MISFSQLGPMGRLGNQLFQIAATIAIAKQQNTNPLFPEWKYSKYFVHADKLIPQVRTIKCDYQVCPLQFHYEAMTLDVSKDIDINGFFQSELFFKEYEKDIRKAFTFRETLVQDVIKKHIPPPLNKKEKTEYVAIHVRRGDYVNNDGYAQLGVPYYKNAIAHLESKVQNPENLVYLVFSDDIGWCKENLTILFSGESGDSHNISTPVNKLARAAANIWSRVKFIEGNSDIEDLMLMSSVCTHFIISNSSFAWWGAWLGEKHGWSQIVCPEQWFGPGLWNTHNSKDIIPRRWEHNMIHPELKYPIDLMDVTFTIPVKFDHWDRVENLELLLNYIEKHFNTNILIYEEDTESKMYSERLNFPHGRYKYVFKKGDGKTFHRTRMLNEMAAEATTPYIANWDADILIKPLQILKAVQALRNNECDGVYPYDGKFFTIDRVHYNSIRISNSLICTRHMKFPGNQHEATSYGGAILWNRSKFIQGGMENEHFISYGPEDYERYERFTKLGYRIHRVPGALFHMEHWRGSDSSESNPFFAANHIEYERIKNLSKEQLRTEVDNWNWTKFVQNDLLAPVLSEAVTGVDGIIRVSDSATLDTHPENRDAIRNPQSTNTCELIHWNNPHFYLVNLKRRPERLAHATRELADIGIHDFELIEAVDGNALHLSHPEKRITPGMIGCYRSHVNIWRDALAKGYESICVWEDDILPAQGFNVFMKRATAHLPDDWEFIYVGSNEYGGFGSYKRRVNDYFNVPAAAWGTQCYMIRGREALEKLLHQLEKMVMQIDEQLATYALPNSGIKYYAVFPPMVQQDFLRFGSDIQEARE